MDSVDLLRIQRNYTFLLENLETENILPFLYQEEVINSFEKDIIQKESPASRQRDKLLDILQTKDSGFVKLCEALRLKQPFILKKLQQTIIYEKDYGSIWCILEHRRSENTEIVPVWVCDPEVRIEYPYRTPDKPTKQSCNPNSTRLKDWVTKEVCEMLKKPIPSENQFRPSEMGTIDTFEAERASKEGSPNEYCTMILKIVKKSKHLQSHDYLRFGIQKKTQTYFHLVGATAQKSVNIRCFIISHFSAIFEGITYKFINLVKKGPKEYWIAGACLVHCTTNIDIPQKIVDKAPLLPEDAPKDGVYRTLADAISWHGALSLVQAKIVAVSPLRYRRDGKLPVISLYTKDFSGTAKLSIFGENTKLPLKINTIVQVTRVFHKTYEGKSYLSTVPESVCQIILDKSLEALKVEENDYPKDDSDFIEDEVYRQNITVNDFRDINIYPCCNTKGCTKKKVTANECLECGKAVTGSSCVVKFVFRFRNNVEEEFSVFENELRNILDGNLDISSKENLTRQIYEKLPLKFSCILKGKNISNIQLKRIIE